MVGAVSVPVQVAWVPSGSALAPTKSMFGSIWVAPVTVLVRSRPCWPGRRVRRGQRGAGHRHALHVPADPEA